MPSPSNVLYRTALAYRRLGMSVIPCKQDKKPLVSWAEYQSRHPSESEIRQWWDKWPSANIAIVTGKISGVDVVDCDNQEAYQLLNDNYLPDDFITPIAKTPKGFHVYFAHRDGLANAVRVIPGTDLRTTGGYVVAPPSQNGGGASYSWVNGLALGKVALAPMPDVLYDTLEQYIYNSNSISNNPRSTFYYPSTKIDTRRARDIRADENVDKMLTQSYQELTEEGKCYHGVDMARNGNICQQLFVKGSRDDDLFHLANCLVKGGYEPDKMQAVLQIIARNCTPPYPGKDILVKILSAVKRQEARDKTLATEVRDWIDSGNGTFTNTDIYQDLKITGRVERQNLSKILKRLADDGLIERDGKKYGKWRIIDRSVMEQCWWEDDGQPLPLKFPLGVEMFVRIFPGNLILLEGQKSQGKSAYALEFCRLNHELFGGKALYQNVEMSNSELVQRFLSYQQEDVMSLDDWRNAITVIRQTGDWWDKIEPDGLNVVDYLVEYEKAYMIAEFVWKIHQALKNGIALVTVQRDPYKPYPVGGRGVRDIPRLVLSLMKHRLRIEDAKSFEPTYGNPSGLVRKYKQASWWKFVPVGTWQYAEEDKYAAFKG